MVNLIKLGLITKGESCGALTNDDIKWHLFSYMINVSKDPIKVAEN